MADPLGTIERLYGGWDLPISEVFRHKLKAYIEAHHTGRSSNAPRHDYSFADTGLDLATHRALVAPYQERYGVPSEV